MLAENGITRQSHKALCYVLIGQSGDSFDAAEKRLRDTWAAGFMPFAMLYRGIDGKINSDWAKFQRLWARPAIIMSKLKNSASMR